MDSDDSDDSGVVERVGTDLARHLKSREFASFLKSE